VHETLPIQQPQPVSRLGGGEALALQEPAEPLGDAASGAAGPKDHDPLIAEGLAQPLQPRQHRRRGHPAGALNVVIEAWHHLAVAIQHTPGVARPKIFPVHQRLGAHLMHCADEGIQEGVVGLSVQAGVLPSGVEGVMAQIGPIGSHIQHHRQGMGGMEAGTEGVNGNFPQTDLDSPHPLITDAQDSLGIGDQQQFGLAKAVTGLAQEIHKPLLIGRRQIHPFGGAAVGLAELLNRLSHGGGVHNRQGLVDVLGQKAVKQGEVALAEELQIGKAFQITAHGFERQPAALHLQLKGFLLPRQEGL